jgi:hypothetical protein
MLRGARSSTKAPDFTLPSLRQFQRVAAHQEAAIKFCEQWLAREGSFFGSGQLCMDIKMRFMKRREFKPVRQLRTGIPIRSTFHQSLQRVLDQGRQARKCYPIDGNRRRLSAAEIDGDINARDRIRGV